VSDFLQKTPASKKKCLWGGVSRSFRNQRGRSQFKERKKEGNRCCETKLDRVRDLRINRMAVIVRTPNRRGKKRGGRHLAKGNFDGGISHESCRRFTRIALGMPHTIPGGGEDGCLRRQSGKVISIRTRLLCRKGDGAVGNESSPQELFKA